MTVMEKSMKKEISALRKAGRDREQDLDTVGSVLQGNQDLINVRASTRLRAVGFFCHARSSRIPTDLKWDVFPGPAGGSRGGGAKTEGGGEGGGVVETEGASPDHGPAGEGRSHQPSAGCTAEGSKACLAQPAGVTPPS